LHAANEKVRQPGGSLVNRRDAIQADPKLVFAPPSGDISVSARVDVWIHPERDGSPDFFASRDAIDPLQLRFALDVETQDAFVERILDFFTRFPDAGEGTFRRRAASFEDAEKFAAETMSKPAPASASNFRIAPFEFALTA